MFTKLVTVTALLLPALALAQGRHGLFEHADPNQDGMITREEFNAARVEQFAKLDRNSDGFIDAADRDAEAANHESGRRHGRHGAARLDADSDGKVSKEEFVNAPTRFFDQADTDKSNVLDAKELETVRAAAKERGREWRKRREGTPPAETTTQ
ncbi:MAG: EF-hand domain-containing protein [Steroidobacteraceae bacterium]